MSKSTPKRHITSTVPDPTALKALAHPMRLRMLGILRVEGPSTATILAKRLSLNTGATSYHLRQLQTHGFIEPAHDLGDKRDRWWRAKHESTHFDPAGQEGDGLEAGMAMTQAVLSGHAQQMQRAHAAYRDLPPEWRKASTASDYIIALTAEQAQALTAKLEQVLMDAMAEAPALGTPLAPDTRPFTLLLHTFPHPGFDDPEPDQ